MKDAIELSAQLDILREENAKLKEQLAKDRACPDCDKTCRENEYLMAMLESRGDSGTWKMETLRAWQKSKKDK